MPRPRKKRPTVGSGISPTYLSRNRTSWNRTARSYEALHRRSLERYRGKAWGTFRIPERRLGLLGAVRGRRVLELGCGAADWSIALAREGARVVGLDFSEIRLAQAREAVDRARVPVTLVRAPAESIPYPNGTFDIVLSDYGATTFSDPERTIPEVSRVLRKGGIFVFAHASPFRTVTDNGGSAVLARRFLRDYFGMGVLRFQETIEFQRPYGAWIDLFTACGLRVDRLVEPQAPKRPQSTYFSPRDQQWARHWPVELIWKLTKTRAAGPPPRRRQPR